MDTQIIRDQVFIMFYFSKQILVSVCANFRYTALTAHGTRSIMIHRGPRKGEFNIVNKCHVDRGEMYGPGFTVHVIH
jgi:hypothetical protein